MEKLMKTLEKNIKNQEKALRASMRQIKIQEKQNAKLERENIKIMKQVNKDKIKEVSKMFNKTKKSFRVKFMHQNKKIAKMLKAVQENQKDLDKNNTAMLQVKFYDQKNVDKKDYNHFELIFDSKGLTKYIRVRKMDVRIPYKLVSQYEVNHFYNIDDNEYKFVRDFVDLIKKNNTDNKRDIKSYEQSQSIKGFMITHCEIIQNHVGNVDFLNRFYADGDENKKINTPYTKYQINLQSTDFKDLLVMHHHQYVQDNFRPYSCLLTAIINKFYDRFNRIKKDGKRRNAELTYSYLCNLFGIEDKPTHNAVSLQTVIDKFFKRYNFAGLYVYSPFMSLLYKHEPSTTDGGLTVLRIIIKDKHVYEINDNIKQLQQKINYEDDERDKLTVGDKYRIIERQTDVLEVFCHEIDEIFETIKANAEVEDLKQLVIITSSDITKILLQIISSGYTPKVFFSTFFI
jgi:hypothetical protein